MKERDRSETSADGGKIMHYLLPSTSPLKRPHLQIKQILSLVDFNGRRCPIGGERKHAELLLSSPSEYSWKACISTTLLKLSSLGWSSCLLGTPLGNLLDVASSSMMEERGDIIVVVNYNII